MRNKRPALNLHLREDTIRLFSRALRRGDLARPLVCQRCGVGGLIDGHHDDYAEPYNVQWLCRKCHGEWHRQPGHIPRARSTVKWIGRLLRPRT